MTGAEFSFINGIEAKGIDHMKRKRTPMLIVMGIWILIAGLWLAGMGQDSDEAQDAPHQDMITEEAPVHTMPMPTEESFYTAKWLV